MTAGRWKKEGNTSSTWRRCVGRRRRTRSGLVSLQTRCGQTNGERGHWHGSGPLTRSQDASLTHASGSCDREWLSIRADPAEAPAAQPQSQRTDTGATSASPAEPAQSRTRVFIAFVPLRKVADPVAVRSTPPVPNRPHTAEDIGSARRATTEGTASWAIATRTPRGSSIS